MIEDIEKKFDAYFEGIGLMLGDDPMVEPQVAKVGACIAAALLTIAEVIQERD